MGDIKVLDKHIAELIAAGEVVERPASIVKELLENSVDAGSKHITVEIKHGGIELIRVSDDGKGIAPDQVETAFLRHATSKIVKAEDLDSILTLGFRGEALASICAVSRVSMMTRQNGNELGCHIEIEGGEVLRNESIGCPNGTTVIVKDVFYNTPARMKFLKKDVSEANAVASVVEKIAVSNSDISFKFIRDGKIELQTAGDGNLLSTIYSVFGKAFSDTLISVDYERNGVKVSGFISKPINARAKRGMQYFFLNGRAIKNITATVALEESFKGSVMVGKFPACVLMISLSPNIVDVNVHPAKTEVRFSDERIVYDSVYFACKNALSNDSAAAEFKKTEPQNKFAFQNIVKDNSFTYKSEQISFDQNKKELSVSDVFEDKNTNSPDSSSKEIFAPKSQVISDLFKDVELRDSHKKADFDEKRLNLNVFAENPFCVKSEAPKIDRQEFLDSFVKNEPENNNADTVFPQSDRFDGARIIGELFETYIMLECDNALYFVDKHAAHERMIYNRLKALNEDSLDKQYLLEPCIVKLSREEYDAALLNIEIFNKTGFDVDDFGNGTVIVRSVPSFIKIEDIPSLIAEISENIVSGKEDAAPELIDNLYHTIACRSAIKAHDKSDKKERQALIDLLRNDESVKYCPHGRPVVSKLSKTEIEKRFGRIQ